jgi:hypothetical protein
MQRAGRLACHLWAKQFLGQSGHPFGSSAAARLATIIDTFDGSREALGPRLAI